jgi:hypothetical protein
MPVIQRTNFCGVPSIKFKFVSLSLSQMTSNGVECLLQKFSIIRLF